jgi:hypothetical protein
MQRHWQRDLSGPFASFAVGAYTRTRSLFEFCPVVGWWENYD